MIRKVVREQTPFEKYFSEAPARKPYMKVVSAFPDGRLKGFDSNIVDDDLEEDLANIELDDDDLVDDTDFNDNIADDIPEETEQPTEINAEPVEADVTNEPSVAGVEPVEYNAPELAADPPEGGDFTPAEEPPVEGQPTDTTVDTPPVEGGEPVDTGAAELADDPPAGDDFSANIDDSSDTSMTDTTTDGEAEGGSTNPPNTIDNQLKYSLYINMKNLYKAIQKYEDRLDEFVGSGYNFNITTKIANKKLVELEETIYQYMTVKFKDADYLVSMNFYQKCIAVLMLIFELMRNNKETDTKDKNDKLKGKTLN